MPLNGDLVTNMKLDGGTIKCHSTTDLVLTQSGDLGLIQGDSNGIRQRMLIWLAVPQGELFDPDAGCPAYDFFHAKLTESNIQRMANKFLNSFRYSFPELDIKNVEITKTDSQTLFVEVYAGNNAIGFLFSKQDIDSLRKNMWNDWAINNLVPFNTEV
jgi:hypothetical protein